jgi:hypothetical protein
MLAPGTIVSKIAAASPWFVVAGSEGVLSGMGAIIRTPGLPGALKTAFPLLGGAGFAAAGTALGAALSDCAKRGGEEPAETKTRVGRIQRAAARKPCRMFVTPAFLSLVPETNRGIRNSITPVLG